MKEHHRTDRLTWITILFVLIIAVVLISYKAPRVAYNKPASALFEQMEGKEYIVDVSKAKELLSDETVTFIDIRNGEEFFVDHIEGATNVPVLKILDDESLKLFKDDKKNFVLYGNDHLAANGPYMLLNQLGFENIKVLLGGYENYKNEGKEFPEFIKDYEQLISAEFDLEKEILNRADLIKSSDEEFVKVIKKAAPVKTTRKPAVKKKAPEKVVIPVEEEEEEEEGC